MCHPQILPRFFLVRYAQIIYVFLRTFLLNKQKNHYSTQISLSPVNNASCTHLREMPANRKKTMVSPDKKWPWSLNKHCRKAFRFWYTSQSPTTLKESHIPRTRILMGFCCWLLRKRYRNNDTENRITQFIGCFPFWCGGE